MKSSRLAVGLATAALFAASCSSDDLVSETDVVDDPGSLVVSDPTAPDAAIEADGDDDNVFTENDPSTSPTSSIDVEPGGGPDASESTGPTGPTGTVPVGTLEVSETVTEPIEPVAETGVPGIESTDPFCRSWSEFAGSYRALGFAWAVQGGEPAATLEVTASDVLSSAADGLAEHLPPELEDEREALTVDLTAPLLRRAERAREIMRSEGLDDGQIETLGDAWLAAVTEQGLESETLTVELPAEAQAPVADAAALLSEDLPPITEDPSLIVDVQIPSTEQYVFENCPDRGVLGGNDRVDT